MAQVITTNGLGLKKSMDESIKWLESVRTKLEAFHGCWLGAEYRRELTALLRELTQGQDGMKFVRIDKDRKVNLYWNEPGKFSVPEVIIYTYDGNKMGVNTDRLIATLEGYWEAQMEMAANAY